MKMPTLAFHAVFRRKDLTSNEKQYQSILADAKSSTTLKAGASKDLDNLKAIFYAIITFQMQEDIKGCEFGIENVSWTTEYLI